MCIWVYVYNMSGWLYKMGRVEEEEIKEEGQSKTNCYHTFIV